MRKRGIIIIVSVGSLVLLLEAALLYRFLADGPAGAPSPPSSVHLEMADEPPPDVAAKPGSTPDPLDRSLEAARRTLARMGEPLTLGRVTDLALEIHLEIGLLATRRAGRHRQEARRWAERLRAEGRLVARRAAPAERPRDAGPRELEEEGNYFVLEMELPSRDDELAAAARRELDGAAARAAEAERHLEIVIRHSAEPDTARRAHALLGDVHAFRGDWGAAGAHYLRAGEAITSDLGARTRSGGRGSPSRRPPPNGGDELDAETLQQLKLLVPRGE